MQTGADAGARTGMFSEQVDAQNREARSRDERQTE